VDEIGKKESNDDDSEDESYEEDTVADRRLQVPTDEATRTSSNKASPSSSTLQKQFKNMI